MYFVLLCLKYTNIIINETSSTELFSAHTCLPGPDHLSEGHTFPLARKHAQGSPLPNPYPYEGHEPADSRST